MRHRAINLMIAGLMIAHAAAILTAQTRTSDSRGYLADPTLSDAQNFSGVWQMENSVSSTRPFAEHVYQVLTLLR